MAVLKVYNGASWDVAIGKVYDGSAWSEKMNFYDGTAQVPLYPTLEVDIAVITSHTTVRDGTVSCNVKLDADKGYYKSNNTGGFVSSSGDWLSSGEVTEVWVERTVDSGTLTVDGIGSGRVACSTDRTMGITWAVADSSKTCTFTYRFYDASSGGNLIATKQIVLLAENTSGGGCPECCFTPDTRITMAPHKTKPIGDVEVGDMILTVNGPEAVTEILTRENRVMYTVSFADGRELKMSEDHPLFVHGKGYAAINNSFDYKDLGLAAHLEVGDFVIDEDGDGNEIVSIEDLHYPETVYTFSTSKFYANGMLVY